METICEVYCVASIFAWFLIEGTILHYNFTTGTRRVLGKVGFRGGGSMGGFEKESRDHMIVSSGWWSCQAGRVEGGDSGTRDELGALHSALRQ